MLFSLYSKKRILKDGMNRLQQLQYPQRVLMVRTASISKINVSNVSVTPLIKTEVINESKNEEKDIIIYRIGSEEPVPVVEEPVIETLHNPIDPEEEDPEEEEV
jgi:hypothetical protein